MDFDCFNETIDRARFALAMRGLSLGNEFDPSAHPRGEAGRFTKMAGGDIYAKAKTVTPEKIADVVAGDRKGLIPPHVGLAVALSDPVFKDAAGREMRFDKGFVAKYASGHGRPFNKADEERFAHVQNAIYAVRHDEHPIITLNGRRILETTTPPYGSQRCYRTDTDNGETWAFSWANKVYIRSIHERAKNNPPYR